MPCEVITCCAMPSILLPSNDTVPARGRSAPAIDFSSVDLPAPLAPPTQTISPIATSSETSEIATSPLYAVVTSRTDSMTISQIGLDHARVAHDVLRRAL